MLSGSHLLLECTILSSNVFWFRILGEVYDKSTHNIKNGDLHYDNQPSLQSQLTRPCHFSVPSRSKGSPPGLAQETDPTDELGVFGALCCRCRMVQKGLSPGSPAGGSQALVTKEASNLELSFILRTAIPSLRSLNRFCFLKAWVIYPVGEQWCSVCWEKPQRRNSPCRIMCFLSFPPSPLPLECWEFRLLRWAFPS